MSDSIVARDGGAEPDAARRPGDAPGNAAAPSLDSATPAASKTNTSRWKSTAPSLDSATLVRGNRAPRSSQESTTRLKCDARTRVPECKQSNPHEHTCSREHRHRPATSSTREHPRQQLASCSKPPPSHSSLRVARVTRSPALSGLASHIETNTKHPPSHAPGTACAFVLSDGIRLHIATLSTTPKVKTRRLADSSARHGLRPPRQQPPANRGTPAPEK
mgnify:CR=1 FL=1